MTTTATSLDRTRFNMIEQQIRPWQVLDAQVLALLHQVKREDFVPSAHKALAFVDMELPLGATTAVGQTMFAPRVEARLLQDLAIQPSDKVLEIGAGSGYMAALLAGMAKLVVTLEIDQAVAQTAGANMSANGVSNVDVRTCDAAANNFAACATEGPWDVILLSGSVAQVPPALLGMLALGGRLAAVVGEEPMMRATFITRTGEDTFTTKQPWDINVARLSNFPTPSPFKF